jgi:hypothetical protein
MPPTDDRVLDALISSARAQERSSKAVEALTAEVRVSNETAATMCRIGEDHLARVRARDLRQEAWAVRFWEAGKPYLLAALGAGVAWLGLSAAGGSVGMPTKQDEAQVSPVQAPAPATEATGASLSLPTPARADPN